jgi:hypothetical protein
MTTVEGAEGPEACHKPVLGVVEPQSKLQLHDYKLQLQEQGRLSNVQLHQGRGQLHICTVNLQKHKTTFLESVLKSAKIVAAHAINREIGLCLKLTTSSCSREWNKLAKEQALHVCV